MEANTLFRNIIEIGFGVLYLVGAIFNSLYTYRHSDEFYGSFAEKAILSPARWLVKEMVISHAKIFTVLLITFQVAVAFCILSRGALVVPGLMAGAIFCLGVVFVSNPGGAIANLVMAILQFYLGYFR